MRMKASGMGLVPSREKACELVLPVLQRVEDGPMRSVLRPGDCHLSQVRRAEAKSHIVRITRQW